MPRLLRSFLSRIRQSPLMAPLAVAGEDPGMGASALVRAGDIAHEAGHRAEALTFYGRAIDAYLERGLHRDAERTCRRLIALEPDVIRTRYTLAMIAVGRDEVRAARDRLADYMAAVARAHAFDMAVPSLLELAAATANRAVRAMAADALRAAGRPDLAERAAAGPASPPAGTTWSRAVRAALRRPGDVDMATLAG